MSFCVEWKWFFLIVRNCHETKLLTIYTTLTETSGKVLEVFKIIQAYWTCKPCLSSFVRTGKLHGISLLKNITLLSSNNYNCRNWKLEKKCAIQQVSSEIIILWCFFFFFQLLKHGTLYLIYRENISFSFIFAFTWYGMGIWQIRIKPLARVKKWSHILDTVLEIVLWQVLPY